MNGQDHLLAQTICAVMEALEGASTTAEGLNACLSVLCDAFDCKQSSAWVTFGSGENLCAVAETGGTNLAGTRIPMGRGITGRVARIGRPEEHDLREARAGFCPEEHGAEFPEGRLLWIPLGIESRRLGCIQLCKRSPGPYSDETRRNCGRIAKIMTTSLIDRGVDFVPEASRKALVSFRDVAKDYITVGGPNRVLKHISLEIYEGELVVIVGESGSGKSTLLNLMGGMDRVTEGQLLLEDEDFSNPTERQLTLHRRNCVGFVFQSYNLMPNLTAIENVAFTSEISAHPMDPAEALAMVGLSDRANYFPSMLSGGQQQRVAIARALAKSPRIILADEPTAALDYETGRGVLEVLQTVVRKQGTTLVMVTHNGEIARIANRIIRIKDGMIHSVRINPAPVPAAELVW